MRTDGPRRRPDDDPELNEMLRALDHPIPRVDAHTLATRARASGTSALRRAAIVLLALGAAGAAWALPGSPLRAWRERSDAPTSAPRAPALQPTSPLRPDAAIGGIALEPAQAQRIDFTSAPGARVAFELVDDGPIRLMHFDGSPRYVSAPDRVRVEGIAAGTRFLVAVPPSARALDVSVGERAVWSWPGDSARTIDLSP